MRGIPLYNLPARQREVLHCIIRHIDDKGQSPTVAEIADACKTTVQNIQAALEALEKKNRIRREKGAPRSITVVQ